MAEKKISTKHKLGVFILAMLTFSVIASLRGLPSMAEYGLSSTFYYLLIAIVFFIPVSLISAELATGWPKKGGVYLWVTEAFGQRWGFFAIWMQWIQNVVWYPTVLAFAAGALAFVFNPALATNPLFMVGVILVVYWGATLAAFRGMRLSGIITTVGTIAGTILPGLVIILLGALWVFSGQQSQIDFTWENLIPDLTQLSNVVFAASILLFFAGMEVSAVHAREVNNPQKDYPKAILIAVVLTLFIFILGTLAIAVVVPQGEINLVAGIMQAFTQFFDAYSIGWMVPIIGILIVFGVVGQVSAWIVGPSKGLLATADEGTLPPFFQKTNSNGVATHVMIVQGLIVSALALIFVVMPDVSSSFWILTALTAQLYLIMYVFLFATAIKLRYSQPKVKRPYKLPGGNLGMWVVAGIGALACLAGIGLGFVPPAQLDVGGGGLYDGFLVAGILILGGTPLLIYQIRKPDWMPKAVKKPVAKPKKKKKKKVK
jgi:putative glutamate/gamma-aminobutyrate antiporter